MVLLKMWCFLFLIFASVIFNSLQYKFNIDCINGIDKGAHYKGKVNVTETGQPCISWSAGPYPNYRTFDGNFCRNPDNSTKTWCYVSNTKSDYKFCNVTYCAYLCPDLNTTEHMISPTDLVMYKVGGKVTFKCQYGYTLIGSSQLTCVNELGKQAMATWTNKQPKCEAVTCSLSSLSQAVYINPSQNIYEYSTSVNMSCRLGYTGTSVRSTCQANRTWSVKPPVCMPVTCSISNLSSAVDIYPRQDTYNYSTSVNISCHLGYTGASVRSSCQANKTWSVKPPDCKPVNCSSLALNVYVKSSGQMPKFNDKVILSCKEGYIGRAIRINCYANGSWPSDRPNCTIVRCPELNRTKHMDQPMKLSDYHYGEKITFKCEDGYILSETPNITCLSRGNDSIGRWSDQQPICSGVVCPFPNVTDNLVLLQNQTEYRFGDRNTFHCVEDFELSSQVAAIRNCVVDESYVGRGKWTGETPFCQAKATAKQSSPMAPAIGGGIGAVVIIIVIVVVLVFIVRRRTGSRKKQDECRHKESTLELDNSNIYSQVQERETKSYTEKPVLEVKKNNDYYNEEKEEKETGGYYTFSIGSQLPKDAIEVKILYEYVEKRRGKDGDILKEFLKLKGGLQKSTDAALKPGNRLKNKYKDMYAYDETRVILDNSSYINASFIQGYGQIRKYIAAQGPLDKTVDDFWSMVWQYDCGKIVMLTNVFENGKEKCIQYWPDHEQQKTTYGSISLLLVKEDVYSDFTVRRIKLQKEKDTKTVLQFHFTAWPDKDVPKYASSLVHFRHKVNTTSTVAKGPLVVHCSAGVGRTGTYIALDYIVNEAKQRDYVEVFRSVEILRNQRVNMVQTAHQYLFLHEAVLEALMCPNSGIPCRDFPNNYKDLMRFDNNKKKHKLQIEYELLNSISSRHDEEAFSKGKSDENREKNRYSNIIPVGSEMPLLSTAVDGRNEYINAVFLPGYRNNQTFIVTQMPLETTVVDLWRLVYDYEIPTIVMLNKDIQTGKSTNVYWPEGEVHVTYGPFKITRTNTSDESMYTCLDLTCKYKNQEMRQVKLFKAKFWKESMIVPGSANDMLSFLSATEDEQSNNRGCGPVLVHCLNGCDKSGLYCVLATVIERLRIEQDVDIQHIIKQMRNRRPQIIPNYEQFQFIYEAVIEYLKEFETYSNFQ